MIRNFFLGLLWQDVDMIEDGYLYLYSTGLGLPVPIEKLIWLVGLHVINCYNFEPINK